MRCRAAERHRRAIRTLLLLGLLLLLLGLLLLLLGLLLLLLVCGNAWRGIAIITISPSSFSAVSS